MQLGKDLFKSAMQKVANFCFTNLLNHQLDHLGTLLCCLCRVSPQEMVKKFVPTCLRILLTSPVQTRRGNSSSSVGMSPKSPGSPAKTPNSAGKNSAGWGGEANGTHKLAALSDMEVCACVIMYMCMCMCVLMRVWRLYAYCSCAFFHCVNLYRIHVFVCVCCAFFVV